MNTDAGEYSRAPVFMDSGFRRNDENRLPSPLRLFSVQRRRAVPIFPKIQSPCPYQGNLAAVMDGDSCRVCKRTVFDLTAMDDGERLAFLAGCEEEVCVSYRVPMRALLAAAALAAAAPALSQEAAEPAMDDAIEAGTDAAPDGDMIMIVAGGIKDPKTVELVEVDADSSVPELPVAYEDEEAPASPTDPAGT
jgi:predicted Fe-S protein YdhL (DUF1289 family)